MLEKKRTS